MFAIDEDVSCYADVGEIACRTNNECALNLNVLFFKRERESFLLCAKKGTETRKRIVNRVPRILIVFTFQEIRPRGEA